jgi:hypothetical protein
MGTALLECLAIFSPVFLVLRFRAFSVYSDTTGSGGNRGSQEERKLVSKRDMLLCHLMKTTLTRGRTESKKI